MKTQIETLSSAVGNFIYTPNEARALLDLEAKPGGDELLGNGASIPVQLAGIQYQNTTFNPEDSKPNSEDNDDETGETTEDETEDPENEEPGEEVKQWIKKLIKTELKNLTRE